MPQDRWNHASVKAPQALAQLPKKANGDVSWGNIRVGQGRQMMRSAVKFVDNLDPDDKVALVAVPGPGALVDFTTEHEKVREGLLATVGLATKFLGRFNISLSEAIATVEHSNAMMTQGMILRECAQALSNPIDAARCELEVEQECSEIVNQQRTQTQASLRGMREVLKSLGALDGPKSVILISEGLVLEGLSSDVDDIAAIAASPAPSTPQARAWRNTCTPCAWRSGPTAAPANAWLAPGPPH